ncbi:hypothetical protein ACWEQ8_18185 [Streptomyces noursei]
MSVTIADPDPDPDPAALHVRVSFAPAAADVARLAAVADRWRPYRSWVATLLRIRAQDTSGPGPACQGAPPPVTFRARGGERF